ncbi:hypothetical protein [Formosa sp. S-31]|uniref:hypothetical protein n=1 Tax=Formosa sp. S-31 TaxID=2790949 RepID=UPI003EBD3BFF
MKKLIPMALCLLFAGSIYAQTRDSIRSNEEETAIAYQKQAQLDLIASRSATVKTTGANASYLNSTYLVNSPTYVKILQQKAALLDLAELDDYDSRDDSDYDVVFDSDKATMSVAYDDMGTIKYSREQFKNVAMPTPVIVSVMKAYPGYRFDGNTCTIEYAQDKGITNTIYKIKISNENDRKTVKVDDEGNLI